MKSGLLATVAILMAGPVAAEVNLPGAISGFGIEDLDRRAVDDTAGMWLFVPNAAARLAPGVGSTVDVTLRGIGGGELFSRRPAGVGTIIDGVPLPGNVGNRFAFFDLDRINILRGPQGVAGGRGFLGGALEVNLARPGQRLAGYLESGYGAHKRWTMRGSIDLPIAPIFGIKVSGYRTDGRGYAYNPVTDERLNDSDAAGLRLAGELRPAPGLTWNVALATMRSDGENLWNADCEAVSCDGRTARTGMTSAHRTGVGGQYPEVPVAGRKANYTLRNRTKNFLVTSNLEWRGAAHGLDVITGYVRQTERYGSDFADGRPLPTVADPVPAPRDWSNGGAAFLADNKNRQLTQEIRLSGKIVDGVGYKVGGFLLDGRDTQDIADLQTLAIGAGQTVVLADRIARIDEKVKAGYGLLSGQWGPLTVTGGVRYSDERRRLAMTDQRAICGIDCFTPDSVAVPEIHTERWTPHASVEWRADEALLLYASARRGYRAGGWNVRALEPATLNAYGDEAGWSYETGLRARAFEDRLRVGLSGFVTRIDDAQATWSRVEPDGRTLLIESATVGDFRNKGAELELGLTPFSGLDLSATLGWQDAEYRANAASLAQQGRCLQQIAGGVGGADCGRGIITGAGEIGVPAYAPEWTFSAGGTWDILWKSGESVVTPGVWVSYQSATELESTNLVRAPGRWLVNASLALATDDGFWMLALECANCLNEDSFSTSLGGLRYQAAPRTWLVKARRNF